MERARSEARLKKLRRAYNDFVDLRVKELSRGEDASICAESFKMIETLLDDDSTRVKKELGIFSHDHKEGRRRKKKRGRPKQKKVIYRITKKPEEPVQLDLFEKAEV